MREIIKRANLAMQTDPACVVAHKKRMAAKRAFELASDDELPKAKAVLETTRAEWDRLTNEVFDCVMADEVRDPLPWED